MKGEEMRIIITHTFDDLLQLAQEAKKVIYGFNTCWWKFDNPPYQHPNSNLPCGPRGEMLLEMHEPLQFLTSAANMAHHYGRHGLTALIAAYHGHLLTDMDRPTSFESWEAYNEVLDHQTEEDTWRTQNDLPQFGS
jgi:hypothetical protein